MDLPKIATDPTMSSNTLYFMPDDVARLLAHLYLKKYWGQITESEYNQRAEAVMAGAVSRIGVIRNLGG